MTNHTAAWWRVQIEDLRGRAYAGLDNRTAYGLARELHSTAQNEYSRAADKAQSDLRELMNMLDESRYANKNPLSRVKVNSRSTATGLPPTKRLKARRKKTDAEEMPGIWANPLMRVTVTSPSQRKRKGIEGPTHSPSGRLRARRKTTKKAPEGFFANPKKVYRVYVAKSDGTPSKRRIGTFTALAKAKTYAREFADEHAISVVIVS